jgi:alpha-galactosidase
MNRTIPIAVILACVCAFLLSVGEANSLAGDAAAVSSADSNETGDIGILTPPAPATPRINGPKVFGVRPGSPFLYTIPVSGERPIVYSADQLPAGLSLDTATGEVTGNAPAAGRYTVTLRARNKVGEADKSLIIIAGDQICLTPPMGWNSWNCWGGSVSQDKVLSSAAAMVEKGLSQHGWSYINIDDGWQGVRGGEFNAIQPNRKFADIKALADRIHAMGLRFGIYSTPWSGTYAGHIGSSCNNEDGTYDWIAAGKHNDDMTYSGKSGDFHTNGKFPFLTQDARQWAAWGVDYLKYDWHPIDIPAVQAMNEALRGSGRDIVYSLSNGASFESAPDYARLSNLWRTSGDITDHWKSMIGEVTAAEKWGQFCGPGHYNDPDMLVVGRVGWGNPQPTRLTHNEQYTHISFWCLFNAPLLIGCDLAQLDDFTLNLLTNDEVLALDQDSLAVQAHMVSHLIYKSTTADRETEVWAKPLDDGSLAVGLFNLGPESAACSIGWADLGLKGPHLVRDLWRQKDLGKFDGVFDSNVPSHGVTLVRIASPEHPAASPPAESR